MTGIWRLAVLVPTLLAAACDPAPQGSVTDPPSVEAPAPAPPSTAAVPVGPWRPLWDDGLHDPANPDLSFLQQPAEALSELPPGQDGNHVDWVAALSSGAIVPRSNIYPDTTVNRLDLDVLMPDTATMPMVLFPHRPHTEWLDCSNCHDRIFRSQSGATPVTMLAILQGEYCGQCHGAVSFPLTQCGRCHSVPRPAAARGAAAGG